MSADLISFSQYGRMPWQSPSFTRDERVVLHSLAHEAMASLAIRDYCFEKDTHWHAMNLICGVWEGAPKIAFSKTILEKSLHYAYGRTDGDTFMSRDFMRAVEFARSDLSTFGNTARLELENHARDNAAKGRRATFALVKK